ncbi:MAG TPA: ABC transporter substrate-binding protein [Burkholderiaceae bacterium]|nr:ABC transporter substrate-binding protein [Burkholderiaceae bacterium]
MKMRRRSVTALAATGLAWAAGLARAQSQGRKDSVVLGMVLEPTGLDPTTAPAAAIGEIVHYNVLEGLTKVNVDGSVTPLLAESWSLSPDGKVYTFKLRRGVKFQDGEPFDAAAVKYCLDRARAEGSTNKNKKGVFDNIGAVATPDAGTVAVTLKNPDGNFLFRMGESTAVILSPKSALTAATQPVGTGPFRLAEWKKGASVSLVRWDGFRNVAAIKLKRVTFRFINEPAAQVAAMLAGDVDGFPRFDLQSWKRFQSDKRFSVAIGNTAGKGILAINNKRKPFDDVRVRRALMHAIDRKAFIDGVLDGQARPIGSHAAPTDQGYVDLSGQYPYDPERARALLKEAGVAMPLEVTLTLPPPQYARKGGEVIAAQLANVGIHARIDNVEWAQWLSGAFKGNFDLTIINHVEPLDFMVYADSKYYFGYDSLAFRDLAARHAAAADPKARLRLFGDIQRMLAQDAVNVFIFNPAQVSLARKGLKGLWASSPIFANDMAAVSWQ